MLRNSGIQLHQYWGYPNSQAMNWCILSYFCPLSLAQILQMNLPIIQENFMMLKHFAIVLFMIAVTMMSILGDRWIGPSESPSSALKTQNMRDAISLDRGILLIMQ